MNASKTRHLDAAIAIFKSTELVKRSRSAGIQVSVHHDPKKNEYLIQVGSRIVSEGTGDRDEATRVATEHAERLQKLGKKTIVVVY